MNQESHDTLPFLSISEHGEWLVGNQEGFGLLRQAVDRLLDGNDQSVNVEGNLEILGLELSAPDNPESISSEVIGKAVGFSCLLIVAIIAVIVLGLAIFGFIQFFKIF